MNEQALLLLTLLVPGLPLLGFLLNGLLGKRLSGNTPGWIATLCVAGSFVASIALFSSVSDTPQVVTLANWIDTAAFQIDFSFIIDRLSCLMLLIVTGVGSLIHLYSIGYMHGDEGFRRFFAYLNLFVFFMLLLVLGSNFLIMFIGWEGVGLCSYLLIGFWFKNKEYNLAAKKAFVMNRIGDIGFVLGMFMLLMQFGTLDFLKVSSAAAGSVEHDSTFIVAATLLLFLAATGKSAQIPLYTWLPDAMAGPTPVSALIHAATMVTAGIYMICRSSVLFALAPSTLDIILIVGTATCVFAAIIGLRQNDIKKVLAYSTVSQLGLMFAALGVGAFSSGVFHLTTHAFFKALLFLGAGSVIHGLSGEQDIRAMGGLKSKMKITYLTFLIASLAISGIPPFAGFFSKDEILAGVFTESPVLWGILQASSLITVLYMFRMLYLTFFGSFRGSAETASHIHESPKVMTFPLIALAVLSVIGGLIGIPAALGGTHLLNGYLDPVFAGANSILGGHHHLSHAAEYMLMAIAVGAAVLVIVLAYNAYVKKQRLPVADAELKGWEKAANRKFYVDELYHTLIGKPLYTLSTVLYGLIEKHIIDAAVNATGSLSVWFGRQYRKIQTGYVGFYIFAMVTGITILILVQLLWR